MTTDAARQVDVEQDLEDREEDAREALLDQAVGANRKAVNQTRRDTRAALADDNDGGRLTHGEE